MGYNPRKRLLETRLFEDDFVISLQRALGGGKLLETVVWASAENEVVVHLNKLQVAVQKGRIIVGLQMECDQFGIQELVLPFAVGDAPENSFLLAVTPENIGGHRALAKTWGTVAAEFVWQGCLVALQDKWHTDKGMDHFKIEGLLARKGMVQGFFAYPDNVDIRKPEEKGKRGVADLVDSLELARIHLGTWDGKKLIPVAVAKVRGKIDTIQFKGGAVMKSADVAALIKKKKVKVSTVVAVKRKGKLYLRGVPDKTVPDLLELPAIP